MIPRKGFDTAGTVPPVACSCSITSFQDELSAKAPWTRTTVGPSSSVLGVVSVIARVLSELDGWLGGSASLGPRPARARESPWRDAWPRPGTAVTDGPDPGPAEIEGSLRAS